MIHRVSQKKLSRSTNARKALLKNLANSLILHERIVTTEAKAKTVRPIVEKLITRSKEDTVPNRRILMSKLGQENSVKKLLELVGPNFKERPGGYTRVIKLNPRPGDRAKQTLIEFVENVSEKAAKEKIQKKTAKAKVEKQEEKTKPKQKKSTKLAKVSKPVNKGKTKEEK
jgi:large subunit ribosomal protein L17